MKLLRPAAVWGVLAALYLFFAGTVDTVEITAMIVCASIGTALAVGLRIVAHRRLAFAPPPLRALVHPLGSLIPETIAVGRDLLGAILSGETGRRGAFVRQPFDPGADDEPRSAGRRALAVIGVSLAPATFVVRGDRSQTMILHGLPAKRPSPDLQWPA